MGPAKWARCWSAWSGAWRDTFAGAALRTFEEESGEAEEFDPEGNLAASAVFGQAPPAGPQWVSRLAPLEPQALAYDKPLCVSLDGFTLHAATRAGAFHPAGREAVLRYVLRPPLAQERLELRPDGLVRITLKKAYADGTIAVDMDPLSLLCRLATRACPRRVCTPSATRACWRRRARGGGVSRRSPPKPPPRATNRVGRIRRAATGRGRSFWRAPSRWTCSPVLPARGG